MLLTKKTLLISLLLGSISFVSCESKFRDIQKIHDKAPFYPAEKQKKRFNRVYGYCVVSFLFIHFAFNITMLVGLFPTIGVPLPFFSYGGSSLIAFTLLLFIFLKLDANRINEW